MKSGKNIILGSIDQQQTDSFLHPAMGDDYEKYLDTMIDQGMIRYNTTIDRLEGVVRSEDVDGNPHPGRWSPFAISNTVGACEDGSEDMFGSYVGSVLNSAEISKMLTINMNIGSSGEFNNYPVGDFVIDKGELIVSGSGISDITTRVSETSPNVTLEVPNDNWSRGRWGVNGFKVARATLDLFNFFDIPNDERNFFYITPYVCLQGMSIMNLGGHVYRSVGARMTLRPITRDSKSADFGKFEMRINYRYATSTATWGMYLTANRFDNFIPSCDPIKPPPAPPPMPSDILIECREDRYNTDTCRSLDVFDYIADTYWQWTLLTPVNVNVVVFQGAVVSSIDTRRLPSGSSVVIDNHGSIVGKGGPGGTSGGYTVVDPTSNELSYVSPTQGLAGRPAIYGDDVQLTINNTSTGSIYGGGGGGGGGEMYLNFIGDSYVPSSGSGGGSCGDGGELRYSTNKLDPDLFQPIPALGDGITGNINTGNNYTYSSPAPWSKEGYKMLQNDAVVIGYGFPVIPHSGGAGASWGEHGLSAPSHSIPAQGLLLVGDTKYADGTQLNIGKYTFTFKDCPTDTRACWDGSVKTRRSDQNCTFPECPKLPVLDYVRESTTGDIFRFEYTLLEHAAGTTVRTGVGRIRFPEPHALQSMDITIQIANEPVGVDYFLVRAPNQNPSWSKSCVIPWDFSFGDVVEFTFEVMVRDLPDTGDPETILDGSPYFGDLKVSFPGFNSETASQLELNVLRPRSNVNIQHKPNTSNPVKSITYSDDLGANWKEVWANWYGEVDSNFDVNGGQIRPDGVMLDVPLEERGRWKVKHPNSPWNGIFPVNILPNIPHRGSTMNTNEAIDSDNWSICPRDCTDSHARGDGQNRSVAWKVSDTNLFVPPLPNTSNQVIYDFWFHGSSSGMLMNYESSVEIRRRGEKLAIAVFPNNGPNSWKWMEPANPSVMIKSDRWYHVLLVLQDQYGSTPATSRDRLIVNGVDYFFSGVTYPLISPSSGEALKIGARGSAFDSYSDPLTGKITEFRVWRGNLGLINDVLANYDHISTHRYDPTDQQFNMNTGRVRMYHSLSNADAQNTPAPALDNLHKMTYDHPLWVAGPFPGIPAGSRSVNLKATWSDNVDNGATQREAQITYNVNKIKPITAIVADPSFSTTVQTINPSRMYLARNPQLDVNIKTIGVLIRNAPDNFKVRFYSGFEQNYMKCDMRFNAADSNGFSSTGWNADRTCTPIKNSHGEYKVILDVRVSDGASNDNHGIGTFPSLLRISNANSGEVITDFDFESTTTPGRTKTLCVNDHNRYNPQFDMIISRSNLVQRGSDGLDDSANMEVLMTGGGGGSGVGDTQSTQQVPGGLGRFGNTKTTDINVHKDDDLIVRVGTGGSADGVGGSTGSLGRTGGSSLGIATTGNMTDGLGHNVVAHPGGGGGGASQILVLNNNQIKTGSIVGGGPGGSGAIVFEPSCRRSTNNGFLGNDIVTRNGRVYTPDYSVLSTFDNQTFNSQSSQDIILQAPCVDDPNTTDVIQGADGRVTALHVNEPETYFIGGGGGGSSATAAGWNGCGGRPRVASTASGSAGSDGVVCITCVCCSEDVNDCLDITLGNGPDVNTSEPAISGGIFSSGEGNFISKPGAVAGSGSIRVKGYETGGVRGDPVAGLYDETGTRIGYNDDADGSRDRYPEFVLDQGLSPGKYYMAVTQYSSSLRFGTENFEITGAPVMGIPVEIRMESIDSNGNVITVLDTQTFLPDGVTRQYWMGFSVL